MNVYDAKFKVSKRRKTEKKSERKRKTSPLMVYGLLRCRRVRERPCKREKKSLIQWRWTCRTQHWIFLVWSLPSLKVVVLLHRHYFQDLLLSSSCSNVCPRLYKAPHRGHRLAFSLLLPLNWENVRVCEEGGRRCNEKGANLFLTITLYFVEELESKKLHPMLLWTFQGAHRFHRGRTHSTMRRVVQAHSSSVLAICTTK